LGTQQVPVGAGIPIHRHFRMDEAFYVLEGSGIFTLNDAQHPFWEGRNDIHSQECLAWVRESSGEELTRENVMRQAANLKNFAVKGQVPE
jgi:oxalate decarboxylase/phosphoglucose isomerase-like protein (cupin superfamily)